MNTHEQIVHRYMDGFRRSDHEAILACLTDDAGDVVVVTGTGHGQHRENGRFRFAYCDLFTFREDLITQVDSYVVALA